MEKDFTPEEKQETDQLFEVFLKLAGKDQEVDWMELKEILDYAMKSGKFCLLMNYCNGIFRNHKNNRSCT